MASRASKHEHGKQTQQAWQDNIHIESRHKPDKTTYTSKADTSRVSKHTHGKQTQPNTSMANKHKQVE